MIMTNREQTQRRQIRLLPLHWLSLSQSKRWLLVAFFYMLGSSGLWLFFPSTHNGTTMMLPLACACWLFRYPGLLISMVLNGLVFQITYLLLLRGMLPDSAFVEGGLIGGGTTLFVGLLVCWLRTAVDAEQAARQQVMDAEHTRILLEQQKREATLAYEHERKTNTLKEHFLLNMSHELRTPLTLVAGALDLLVEHQEYLDLKTRMDLLKQAQMGQEELTHLVEQVLETTRMMGEIPVAKPEVVPIAALLEHVLAMVEPVGLAAYTVHLQMSEQASVWADPQFLRQIVRNLLVNICKYVPPHTVIRIEATQADTFSPLCLVIQDAGPGIPADELPLLFERFVRLKRDQVGATRGTGLGLYLCKRMVEAMEGQIWAESSGLPGEGSRFCLVLPPSPQRDSPLRQGDSRSAALE